MMKKNKNEFIESVFIFIVSSILLTIMDELVYFIVNGTWVYRQTLIYGVVNPVYGIITTILYILRKRISENIWYIITSGVIYQGYFVGINFLRNNVLLIHINEYSLLTLSINFVLSIALVLGCDRFWNKLFIDKRRILKMVTIIAFSLYLVDVIITVTAINRYAERKQNIQAGNIVEILYDKVYNDDFLFNQFPGLK